MMLQKNESSATQKAKTVRFGFFGTPKFAEIILDELEEAGFLPSLIVSVEDKPKGRKLLLTPSETKVWGQERKIRVLTPSSLSQEDFIYELNQNIFDLFIVAAYGKIIPQSILDLPINGTLNVHPSLLPKYRGSSPIESALLTEDSETGVSIMVLDSEMDHGPIVAQKTCATPQWPMKGSILTDTLAHAGGALLAESIRPWIETHRSSPQNHALATFTKKIRKEDGLIDLLGDPKQNYKKILAYDEWPGAYFFLEKNGKPIRVRITEAYFDGISLTLLRVVPEGKKEMSYQDFLRGFHA